MHAQSVSCLTSLRALCLSNNLLRGLPDGLTCLTNLTYLDASVNALEVLPRCITALAG